MANGIDSIYDPSDVSRMLAELREQRLQMEEARAKKVKGTTTVGTKAWEMWSGEQVAKERELLATKKYITDPKYTEKNWLSRSFTPASKRVIPAPSKALISKDVLEGRANILDFDPEYFGGTEVAKGGAKDVAAKFGLKEVGSGIGAGVSLYDTISSWNEHTKNKNLKRGVDVAKTIALTGSAIPGPHQVVAAPVALGLTLADLFI